MKQGFCILTGIYAPDTGGPAKFAETFSNYVTDLGFTSNVITYTNSRSRSQIMGCKCVEATSRGLPIPIRYLRTIMLLNKQVNRGARIIANGCFIELAILRIFRKFNYTVKIPGDIVWERARNTSRTNLSIAEFQKIKLTGAYKFFRFLFTFSLKSASQVIVPSSQLFSLAEDWGVDSSKISLIYNSVKVPNFIENSIREYDFVTVSRLVPWKGTDEIIKEVCGMGLSLLIVGDGPERKKLLDLSVHYPGLVTFVGEVEADKVKVYLNKARYFILNSSFEATSYALIEAMALGLVPIANGETGSDEVINHGVNGFLFGGGSKMTIRDAIHALEKDKEGIQKMAIQAHRTVDVDFNLNINYCKIIQKSQNAK
jgi:glycosyltransferase involved in cell wall biosynthesis